MAHASTVIADDCMYILLPSEHTVHTKRPRANQKKPIHDFCSRRNSGSRINPDQKLRVRACRRFLRRLCHLQQQKKNILITSCVAPYLCASRSN